jgi:hypothetical protein
MLIDLLTGASAAAFVAVWLRAGGAWAIPAVCILLIAACAAGWLESSVRSVWTDPFVIMSPALVTLACGALILCPALAGPRGFECAWLFILLVAAVLFTFVLAGLTFATFFIRRWATGADTAT